ncbi:hypothetical protein D3C85_737800 [compost metagenome]
MRELGGVDAGAGNDGRTQVRHEIREVAVVGGLRHQQVKLEIGRDRVAADLQRVLECIQRAPHLLQLRIAAPDGGQPRGLAFQADTQFQQDKHVAHRGDVGRVHPEVATAAGFQRVGAHAMMRLDQAGGLQARQRLAHDGPAYAELTHDLGLGGQLVAGADFSAADALGNALHQALGQVPGTTLR